MKALVLSQYRRFEFRDVPDPAFGPDEVLVRVRACGICGSDVHGMDGSTGRRIPPIIMGHEAAGEIVAAGERAGGWRAGDRVTFDSTVFCGTCRFCRSGQVNLCDDRRVLGVSCAEYRRDGAFAELVVVPRHILYRLPDAVSFEHAAMVEPLAIALHGVRRAAPRIGDTAAVVGAGMIGLLAVRLLRIAGCGRIVAVDVDRSRLERARRLGADAAVEAGRPEALDGVLAAANGGADLAIEAVGAGEPVDLALRCVRKGGTVVLIGNVSPRVEFPLQAAVTRELSILGSCASNGEYTASLDLIARGALDPGELLSATAPLAEGAAWFERLYRKEPGLLKVVLRP